MRLVLVVAVLPTSAIAEPAHDLTVEAAVGAGFVSIDEKVSGGDIINHHSFHTATTVPTFGVGVGRRLSPELVLTGRIVGVRTGRTALTGDRDSAINLFVGPSLQLRFPDSSIWLGGGLGLGLYAPERRGLGIDFRIGYTFDPTARHAIDVSVEFTPCFYGGLLPSGSATSITMLLGYQYL